MYGPAFLIDGVVITGSINNNWFTAINLPNPWFEISLTEPVDIAALEFSTLGAGGGDVDKFRKIAVRAGMTPTSVPHQGSSNNLITDNEQVLEYVGPASQGEVVYVTFPNPRSAQFLLIQAKSVNNNLMLSEIRIIKCMLIFSVS